MYFSHICHFRPMTQPNPLKTKIFDPFPTQPNSTQPNQRVNPTHGQLCAACAWLNLLQSSSWRRILRRRSLSALFSSTFQLRTSLLLAGYASSQPTSLVTAVEYFARPIKLENGYCVLVDVDECTSKVFPFCLIILLLLLSKCISYKSTQKKIKIKTHME